MNERERERESSKKKRSFYYNLLKHVERSARLKCYFEATSRSSERTVDNYEVSGGDLIDTDFSIDD